MVLILVRHAKACERDAVAWPDDALRPLTDEGRRDFRRFARALRELVGGVDAVESSGFARAWQTALLLAEHAGFPAPSRLALLEAAEGVARGEAGDPTDALCRRLDAEAPGRTLVWVGHEPELSRLASRLLTGDPEALSIDFRKGAALALGIAAADGGPRRAELLWMVAPGQARRIRRGAGK